MAEIIPQDLHKGYRGDALACLKRFQVSVWSDVEVASTRGAFTGIILPRSESADDKHIVMKLRNGYNVGLAVGTITAMKELGRKEAHYKIPEKAFPYDPAKPTVKLLGTGGTIASRLDYRTGAVIPAFSPGELYGSVPELADICNIETEKLYGVFSENMGPEQWIGTANAIGREIERGVSGIIIGHGTDTMHHTAAILSFMVQDSAGSDHHGRFAAVERSPLERRGPQSHQRDELGGARRHRRGHGLHVRPDERRLRTAPPRHARAKDAFILSIDLPHDRRHSARHGGPRALHPSAAGLSSGGGPIET